MKKKSFILFTCIVLLLILSKFALGTEEVINISPQVFAADENDLQMQNEVKATVSAIPTVPVSLVKTLSSQIDEYTGRLVKINNKIGSRINKIKKTKAKINSITIKYADINRQIQLLKQEVSKLGKSSLTLQRSKSVQKDYSSYKNQLLATQNAIKTVIASQKDIIADMTKIPTASAVPTVIKK